MQDYPSPQQSTYPPIQQPNWTQASPTPPPPPYGQLPPPPPKRRKLSLRTWIIIIVVIVLLAIVGAISNAQNPQTQASPTTQTQPTSNATTAPTATLTTTQRVQQLVQANATLDDKVETSVQGGTVVVTETLSEAFDNNGYQLAMKDNCFNIEKALWTSKFGNLTDIEINFQGPLVDQYGNTSVGAMGACELLAATAAKFNWSNLSPDMAWQDYDNAVFASAVQS